MKANFSIGQKNIQRPIPQLNTKTDFPNGKEIFFTLKPLIPKILAILWD